MLRFAVLTGTLPFVMAFSITSISAQVPYDTIDGEFCDGACCNAACCDSEPQCDGGCDGQCGTKGYCGWLENLSVFAGLEGSKAPQDFGVNANFGGRFHANMGIPLIKSCGLGLQIGTALNFTANAVQVVERMEGSKDRFQNFTTLGFFQRTDCGFSWALGYDFLYQTSYDDFRLGQFRGDIGMKISPKNEVGTWFAFGGLNDQGDFGGASLTLDPIAQGSLYWRHNWENDAQTTLWLGVADGHGEANAALGDLSPVSESFVFGSDLLVPLSPKCALYGQANFLTPADTGTVDAFLGIAFFPGGSHGARDRRFAPRLSVANNTSFANDLTR